MASVCIGNRFGLYPYCFWDRDYPSWSYIYRFGYWTDCGHRDGDKYSFYGWCLPKCYDTSFAIIAAAIITWATRHIQKIEAFIGLLYALGISSIMLILARSAEGTELFSKLSAADILFTSSDELIKSIMIYSFVAFVMFVIYPKTKGIFKEFLFFVMLAITVTSSVQSAGVLVVFSLLIAPAYAGISQKKFKPFVFACVFGSISIIVALFASYHLDLPTGYAIIFTTVIASLIFVVLSSKSTTEVVPPCESRNT